MKRFISTGLVLAIFIVSMCCVSTVAESTPSEQVSPTPSASQSPEETVTVPETPIVSPIVSPSASPSVSPLASPTVSPIASPIASPTASPIASPTASPIASPTTSPIASPTATPKIGNMRMIVGSIHGNEGDTVTVPIKIDNVPALGVKVMDFYLEYDPDKVIIENDEDIQPSSLISTNKGSYLPQNLNNAGWFSITYMINNSADIITTGGVVAEVTFTLQSDIAEGTEVLIYDSENSQFLAGDGKSEINVTFTTERQVTSPVSATSTSTTPSPNITSTQLPTPTKTPGATKTPAVTTVLRATPSPKVTTTEPANKVPSLGDFKDAKSHWSKNYVQDLLEKGILKGYDDGTIRPDREISRVETVALVVKAIGLAPSTNANIQFKDAKDVPDWAKGYIQAALDAGILTGYKDNTFRPNKMITRAEMIAITSSAFKLEKSNRPMNQFTDEKSIQQWAKGYIAKAFELELVKGYPDKKFRPNSFITRAEAFVILVNYLRLKNL